VFALTLTFVRGRLTALLEQKAAIRAEWKRSVGIVEQTNPWNLGEDIDLFQKYGHYYMGEPPVPKTQRSAF